jgi:hypothetical protein
MLILSTNPFLISAGKKQQIQSLQIAQGRVTSMSHELYICAHLWLDCRGCAGGCASTEGFVMNTAAVLERMATGYD